MFQTLRGKTPGVGKVPQPKTGIDTFETLILISIFYFRGLALIVEKIIKIDKIVIRSYSDSFVRLC